MVLFVEVEDRTVKKPFLGGWRNINTGVEYLNAVSQTGPPPKKVPWCFHCSRKTQSVETREAYTEPRYHQATQMCRMDCYIPNVSDKYMTAKAYETYEEMQTRLDIDGHVRAIQKYYRAYRLRKYIKKSAALYRQLVADCRANEAEKALIYRRRHQHEILRKTYPKSRADFDMLKHLIDVWRLSRHKRIRKCFFRGAQRAANSMVLEYTVEMLKGIDKLKEFVKKEYTKRKSIKFLTFNCKPVRWNGYKAKPTQMVTVKIERAREYKSIYTSLNRADVTNEERIEMLLTLKNSLKTHNCYAVNELVYLLDQEITLLSRGIKNLLLDHLRNRLSNAFLYFVKNAYSCSCMCKDDYLSKDPDCEELREPLETNMLFCRKCSKLLPYNRFSAHVRMRKILYCNSCTSLQEGQNARINYDPYTFLLNGIRADERKRNSYTSLVFIMREPGIYHLVNNIWHGHSIISENDDLFVLRLVRFNIDIEWAPWNCILLTEAEAETHYYIEDFRTVYSIHLLQKIYLAHEQAKSHFKDLNIFEMSYRVSSRYYMVEDRKEYRAPATIENYDPRVAPYTRAINT